MAAHALALVAIAALATAGVGGAVVYTDLEEFELNLSVVDALTDQPIAGASVEIKDANGVLVASGLTDDDGEYEIEVDDQGTEDFDDDETPEMEEIEDEATLSAVAGPLTVTVSMSGYETQTFTVDLDTWDDEDVEIHLVPTTA